MRCLCSECGQHEATERTGQLRVSNDRISTTLALVSRRRELGRSHSVQSESIERNISNEMHIQNYQLRMKMIDACEQQQKKPIEMGAS